MSPVFSIRSDDSDYSEEERYVDVVNVDENSNYEGEPMDTAAATVTTVSTATNTVASPEIDYELIFAKFKLLEEINRDEQLEQLFKNHVIGKKLTFDHVNEVREDIETFKELRKNATTSSTASESVVGPPPVATTTTTTTESDLILAKYKLIEEFDRDEQLKQLFENRVFRKKLTLDDLREILEDAETFKELRKNATTSTASESVVDPPPVATTTTTTNVASKKPRVKSIVALPKKKKIVVQKSMVAKKESPKPRARRSIVKKPDSEKLTEEENSPLIKRLKCKDDFKNCALRKTYNLRKRTKTALPPAPKRASVSSSASFSSSESYPLSNSDLFQVFLDKLFDDVCDHLIKCIDKIEHCKCVGQCLNTIKSL